LGGLCTRGLLVTIPVPRGRLSRRNILAEEKRKHVAPCGVIEYVQIPSDNVLENGTLSTRLRSDDGDLGKVYGVVNLDAVKLNISNRSKQEKHRKIRMEIAYSYCCEHILKLIDKSDQARIVDVNAPVWVSILPIIRIFRTGYGVDRGEY
jgi:hypothetical protein